MDAKATSSRVFMPSMIRRSPKPPNCANNAPNTSRLRSTPLRLAPHPPSRTARRVNTDAYPDRRDLETDSFDQSFVTENELHVRKPVLLHRSP